MKQRQQVPLKVETMADEQAREAAASMKQRQQVPLKASPQGAAAPPVAQLQ